MMHVMVLRNDLVLSADMAFVRVQSVMQRVVHQMYIHAPLPEKVRHAMEKQVSQIEVILGEGCTEIRACMELLGEPPEQYQHVLR